MTDGSQKKEIEKVMKGMSCLKDFACYKSGFSKMCKIEDIGLESFVKCLEDNSLSCEFSSRIGETNLCRCPLRIYAARNLGK